MKWLKQNINNNIDINKYSIELSAVSQYLDIFKLPERFKKANSEALPVINMDGKIVGIVSEYDIAQILPEWSADSQRYKYNLTVEDLMVREIKTKTKSENIYDIIPEMHRFYAQIIPITNNDNTYTGKCLTRSKIIEFLTQIVKPFKISGMPTPFGIYLTDGKHQAGTGNTGLFLSGITIALMLVIAQALSAFLLNPFKPDFEFILLTQFIIFIFLFKLSSVSKFHTVEHQIIQTMETGLPLKINIIKKQKTTHNHCRGNLIILLLSLQFFLLTIKKYAVNDSFKLFFLFVVGSVIIFQIWKKFGAFFQTILLTPNVKDKYILKGIKAGEDLIRKHKHDKEFFEPSIFQRIWSIGLIQILLGFLSAMWVFDKLILLL